ncbi:hypothetical protein [Pseudoxanthomonas mexicana]
MSTITYTKHGNTYLIRVSPDLVRVFRSAFRPARWSHVWKVWVMSATARVRAQLDDFIKSLAIQQLAEGAQ